MSEPQFFRTTTGQLKLPIFFPDATRGSVRTVDSQDLYNTQTPGILVNTFHLYLDLDRKILQKSGGIKKFMGFSGGVISDSGGFQVMSVIKKGGYHNSILDSGIKVKLPGKPQIHFTPEESIRFQMDLKSDMVVALDDFTQPTDNYSQAKQTVDRTILWAQRSKNEFSRICRQKKLGKNRPYLLGVVQGGNYLDLRKTCTQALVEIGFDGLGYGGWPIHEGKFNYEVAKVIAENAPDNYFLYGLGIGKPEEVVGCHQLGYTIFDCVLPTRDARHKRLYVFKDNKISKVNLQRKNFYNFYTPDKEKYKNDTHPVSQVCDCLLCRNYSRGYLYHLFKVRELSALRLATIHNLRFYSQLMEKLQNKS